MFKRNKIQLTQDFRGWRTSIMLLPQFHGDVQALLFWRKITISSVFVIIARRKKCWLSEISPARLDYTAKMQLIPTFLSECIYIKILFVIMKFEPTLTLREKSTYFDYYFQLRPFFPRDVSVLPPVTSHTPPSIKTPKLPPNPCCCCSSPVCIFDFNLLLWKGGRGKGLLF